MYEESQRKSAYRTRSFVAKGAVTVPLNNGCQFQLVLNNNTSTFGSPSLNQSSDICMKRLPNGSASNKPKNRSRNNSQKLRDPGNARKKLLEHVESTVHTIPETRLPFWVLTGLAINSLEHKRGTVKEIYEFIEHYFPYHEAVTVNWKNSVRHCLTYSRFFSKFTKGGPTGPVQNTHMWTFADGTENAFWEQVDMITKRFNSPVECGMAQPEMWSQVTGGRAMGWIDPPKLSQEEQFFEAKPLPYSPANQTRSQDAKPLPYSPANYSYAEEKKPPVLQERPQVLHKPSVWEKPMSLFAWMSPNSGSLSPVFSTYGGSQENFELQSPLTPFSFGVPQFSGFSKSPVTPYPRFSSDAWSTVYPGSPSVYM